MGHENENENENLEDRTIQKKTWQDGSNTPNPNNNNPNDSGNFKDNSSDAMEALQLKKIAESCPESIQLKQWEDNINNGTGDDPLQKKENKTGLPDKLKSGMENLSGHSLDDLKVHYNSAEPSQLKSKDSNSDNQQPSNLSQTIQRWQNERSDKEKSTTQLKTSDNEVAQLEGEENLMSDPDQNMSVPDEENQSVSTETNETEVNQEPLHSFTYEGVYHQYNDEQYNEFVVQQIANLRREIGLQLNIRVTSARSLWDHFLEMNDDQYIVSWLVEWTSGADLPPESVISAAESAYSQVEAALDSGNLTTATNAIASAQTIINSTIDTMTRYREAMISGGGNWVTGLQVTSTACFTIAAVAGGAVLALPVALGGAGFGVGTTGAIMGGSTAFLSSAANEAGEGLAGTQDDDWGWDIIRNTLIGAVAGGIGGEISSRLAGPAANALVSRIGISAFGEMGEAAACAFVKNILNGSLSSAFGGAITDATGIITGDQTWEGFLQNLVVNLIAGGIAGHLADRLPPNYQEHFRRIVASL